MVSAGGDGAQGRLRAARWRSRARRSGRRARRPSPAIADRSADARRHAVANQPPARRGLGVHTHRRADGGGRRARRRSSRGRASAAMGSADGDARGLVVGRRAVAAAAPSRPTSSSSGSRQSAMSAPSDDGQRRPVAEAQVLDHVRVDRVAGEVAAGPRAGAGDREEDVEDLERQDDLDDADDDQRRPDRRQRDVAEGLPRRRAIHAGRAAERRRHGPQRAQEQHGEQRRRAPDDGVSVTTSVGIASRRPADGRDPDEPEARVHEPEPIVEHQRQKTPAATGATAHGQEQQQAEQVAAATPAVDQQRRAERDRHGERGRRDGEDERPRDRRRGTRCRPAAD